MQFIVDICRTETYHHRVLVDAKDEISAKRKVQQYDDNDGFCDQWNEGDFAVNTEYYATPKDVSPLPNEIIQNLEVVR